MTKVFTDGNFEEEVLKSDKPVLVDFYADWCGPCKMMAPVLETLSNQYEGKIVIGKLNVDENSETASRYQVRSIPYMVLFQNGQVVDSLLGLTPAESVEAVLKKVL
ncbi:thioredoxin [Hominifimenecus sp. rT4P-3]|uniref:thioredoxin n=1 Tax=Hominifimenecus sp. rT4P-3 TaxID=3242979 RepID=UPI003DA2336C